MKAHRLRWRVAVIAIPVLLLAAVIGEFVGRAYGLHRPVVYQVTGYGYRVAPNQDMRRFGHRIHYNAQGLRSEAVTPLPPAGVTRILCLGDSVTNGGAVIDQAETLPYRLETLLRQRLGNVEVLNASAPGWAIANELGWLAAHGTQGSHIVVLVISTHDLFQPLAAASVVGSNPSFPASAPPLALQELVRRYLLPMLFPEAETADPGAAGVEFSDRQAAQNRADVLSIAHIVRERQGRLLVVFLEQAGDSEQDTRTLGAKRQLFALLGQQDIPVVTLGEELDRHGRNSMFRDDVHPNPAGNLAIAKVIARDLAPLASPSRMAGRGDTRIR